MTAPAKEAELYLVAWRGDAARNILYSCCHILKQRDVYIYNYVFKDASRSAKNFHERH